jgi:hypothetical protein
MISYEGSSSINKFDYYEKEKKISTLKDFFEDKGEGEWIERVHLVVKSFRDGPFYFGKKRILFK